MFRGLLYGMLMMPVSSLNASEHNRRIVKYSLEQGLSQVSVNTIIQDSYGYLWIGTQDGLNKFNGYDFVVYRHQPSDPNSLSNSNIQSVIEDRDGNIWAGTQDGLNKFDRATNTFEIFRHDPADPGSVSRNDISRVYQDRRGSIWLKTGEGIDRLDPGSGIFTHFPHFNDVFNYISGPGSFPIYEDSSGRLWVGSKDGMFLFDREKEVFTRYFHDPEDHGSISNNNIRSIIEITGRYLLVGTGNGLNLFDPNNKVFRAFHIDDSYGNRQRINNINSIKQDSRGTLWVGTNGGLFSSVPGRKGSPPFSLEDISVCFPDMEVTSIVEDRSGNIWVGTIGGLYMIDARSKFKTYRIHDFMPDSPRAASFIASIFQVNQNELWLGTWGAGLFIINRQTGETRHYSANAEQRNRLIPDDFVHVIFRDSQNRILIGTRNGIVMYKNHSEGFESFCPSGYPDDCLVFNSNRIYGIMEDSRQVLWIGTRYGLHSFNDDILESYYHIPMDPASIPSNHVNDIIECRSGYIWLATANGLSRFNRETGEFRNYLRNAEMGRYSLSHNELTCLHEDSSGNLWIGSITGLNRFFENTESFIVFSELEGLPNNLIYAIEEDNNGHLWLSTNYGLARFDPSDLEITNYDVADGLQNYEFNLGASYKSDEGEMFFGGIDGVNAFLPDSIEVNSTIPPLVVTSFEIFSPEGNMFINIRQDDEIVLRHFENSIGIEFAALDFTRPGKNKYAYILEGLEDKWTYPGNRRIANYSRIPAGSYTFRVKGSNNDDIWNEDGFSFRIIIIAPWWLTVYAYIGYSLVISFFIYLLVFYSTRQLRHANLVLKEKELASHEISRQKEELTLKNRNITDSINYAKRIQIAMMPNYRQLSRLFPESFIYYKPKDIVSGDFYWVSQVNDKVFFAVIDCTGHGVAGAFMSIIGFELIRNIINVKCIEKPAEILNILNEDFSGIFSQGDERDISFRDGMDMGFCVLDRKTGTLEFAGAFSPLYLVRDNKIMEIKGNRFSVGLMNDLTEEKFKNHNVELQKDDVIYLFSDGYPDQFGGEEGKKFKYRRFRHLLLNIHSQPASRQRELLDQGIIQWMGDHEQVDDILVMGIRPGISYGKGPGS